MEIDITELFDSICPSDYSASIAEIGTNAGQDTWNASLEEAESWQDELLATEEEKQAFIDHMISMGFGETESMAEWPHSELVALFIQLVSGDMRGFIGFGEDGEEWDWQEYENSEDTSGNLFQGIDGKIYYYLGY